MRRIGILLLILGYSVIVHGQRISKENIKPLSRDTLTKFMQQTMHDFAIPGIAVSIFTGDKILNQEVSGLRRIHSNDSIKLNDKFHLGSCGKAMTGFVAGKLVEKGLITWDTKIFDIFPELKDSSNSAYLNVTLNELLSHRSGIMPFTEDWSVLSTIQGKDNITKRYNFCKWLLRQTPVEIDSIKKYTYSNAGYAVAASMMERVTGKFWNDLITDVLFNHLQIHANFGWPALLDKNQPWGHFISEDDSLLISHSPNDEYQMDDIITPAGNYSMSIVDYVKFLQLNLRGINGRDSILKSSTYNYLHYCHFDSTVYKFPFYSIGWGVYRTPEEYTISSHNGSAGTFYCWVILFKELDLGLVIITNSGEDESTNGVKKLKNKILEQYK